MKQNNFWLRALNVRADEGWLVKKLFLLQFFQGAGIAFFFTASFALFLARFPITELPYVFIYSSLLLWLFGFIYSRIEHHFPISKLAVIITVFMILCMLMFRLAFVYVKGGWFLYWMMAWFNVLYLLNNLEFWGLASLLFDARQSKRLFGVISAGDIPAKFIGYSVALLTVQYVGTINLLWAGIICMVASIPFLISIKKSGILHEDHQHHPKKHHTKPAPGDVTKIVKNFSGNILIRRLSVLSIIVTGSFIITNFAFYAGVKEAYHDDVSLAKFIALFLAAVRIIAMIVKMIFTSRLINNLGITKSLLITPVVMLLLLFGIVFTQNLPGYQKIIIYLFGITSIVVDILRSAISTPVFLTIMQPLPNHERLRAHTIVKGIMDPFASLLTGVMLLLVIHYQHEVNLLTLTYILLIVCILWIIGIYRINSQYLKTVIKTLSNRYFSRDDFSVTDTGTQNWLKEKVKTSSETEGINILNMLSKNSDKTSAELIIDALQHPSENVKIAALKLMQQKEYPDVAEVLLPFLQQNSSPAIVAESIKILSKSGVDSAIILPYLNSSEIEIRQAALEGLFYYGSTESKAHAHDMIHELAASPSVENRQTVANILNYHNNNNEVAITLQLMNDPDKTVRGTAFAAAGKSSNKLLLKELMARIETDESFVLPALQFSGERSLTYIFEYLINENTKSEYKEKLIFLLGRIGGKRAEKILLDLFAGQPKEYINLIKALYRSHYTPKPEEQQVFIDAAKNMLSRCAGIIYMRSSLEQQHEKYYLLINSFHLELNSLRESLLYVFAILYGHENINRVRTAFSTGKKDTIINAMEIIDIAVRKDLAIQFNIIFEPGNISERMQGLRKIYPPELFNNAEEILIRILAADTKQYNNWTTACSLYTSKKQQHIIEGALVKKHIAAENIMVRETALYVSNN